MTTRMFRPYDPDEMWLLPPSPRNWLPEGHLAYFAAKGGRDHDSQERDRPSLRDVGRDSRRTADQSLQRRDVLLLQSRTSRPAMSTKT